MFTYDIYTILLLFLSCITQITYAKINQQCFAHPTEEIAPNRTVHYATSFKANYFEASHYCRKHCMHLVSIHSEIEHKAIENHIKNSPYERENFWTSGSDLAEEGTFVWASTGERISYTNWLGGQPDNRALTGQAENCLHIWGEHNHKWNDAQCNQKFYFICEIPSYIFINPYSPS